MIALIGSEVKKLFSILLTSSCIPNQFTTIDSPLVTGSKTKVGKCLLERTLV